MKRSKGQREEDVSVGGGQAECLEEKEQMLRWIEQLPWDHLAANIGLMGLRKESHGVLVFRSSDHTKN